MQSSHAAAGVDVAFDDPNLIADAGLVPVVAPAEQIGLPGLVGEQVTLTGAANNAGANPGAKVMSVVAGMVAGADSIEDLDRLRHAGNAVVFDEIRASSTLGSFLRAFTHGHVQQLNAVLRQALIRLAERASVAARCRGGGVRGPGLHPPAGVRLPEAGCGGGPVDGHEDAAPADRHGLHPDQHS